MNNIEILEEYIKEVWKPKPIHNVIPDWATIEKEEIQAIENLIKENKELKEKVKGMYDKSNKLIEVTNLYLNSIPKSKVKEKIEELEKLQENNKKDLEQAINTLNFKEIEKISMTITINLTVRTILNNLLKEGE